ncbi:MAG TPA: ArsC family reductase [Gammaproteobacteria bacterium]|nr:ArsC family reductase [Gammaproteobacteria bacterium]
MITIYGIKNCDTMKKARQWLDEHSVAYVFHDYRKAGISPELIQLWIEKVGWEALLNKRGTTWRNLSEEEKTDIDATKAGQLMCKQPALIKRPVLVDSDQDEIQVGFSTEAYHRFLKD